MPGTLTIGDFARATHITIKTLRRYHELGLLQPAAIDPSSGYRYYSTDQIPTAQVIRRFRDLDMPTREIAAIVATTDVDARARLIANHLARLEAKLDQTRAAVASLRRLVDPDPPALVVEHRAAPALLVAAITASVARDDVLDWYSEAMDELRAAVVGSTVTGPAGGLYDNTLFTDDLGQAVVYLPVAAPPTTGRVAPFIVPAAELAIVVHRGPHDDIDVTYGQLGSYVARSELTVAGPVREIYLVGPRDTSDASAWRTEIGWPVFRTG
ncbi:MAG: MerR family transcriptional regulator [Jatrophihabitantaceae bacterium]|nr:MerR family transcriptional regulator [Jatrophihabitantaceae bacterium]